MPSQVAISGCLVLFTSIFDVVNDVDKHKTVLAKSLYFPYTFQQQETNADTNWTYRNKHFVDAVYGTQSA